MVEPWENSKRIASVGDSGTTRGQRVRVYTYCFDLTSHALVPSFQKFYELISCVAPVGPWFRRLE